MLVDTKSSQCDPGQSPCLDLTCIYDWQFCDFRQDCADGSDEFGCDILCDFETPCEWKPDETADFNWALKDGEPEEETMPNYDNTLGTSEGKYLYVISDGTQRIARYVSAVHSIAAKHCMFRFFFHYQAPRIGDLYVILLKDGEEEILWNLGITQLENMWTEMTVDLPCMQDFQIVLEAEMDDISIGQHIGHIAVDDIEFVECAYDPLPADVCPEKTCGSGHCYTNGQACDFEVDCCMDDSDEAPASCVDYTMCDFETGFCTWKQLVDDDDDWAIRDGSGLVTVPGYDHTTGTAEGHYTFADSSGILPPGSGVAHLASYVIDTSLAPEGEECLMRYYFHMAGEESGTMNIYYRLNQDSEQMTLVRNLTGSFTNMWIRDELVFQVDEPFEVIIEGVEAVNLGPDKCIDDTSFTPGCVPQGT
ncbi:MAM and LDL-receptor class A domain-containing protein 1-like [Glandiceps talaboti]